MGMSKEDLWSGLKSIGGLFLVLVLFVACILGQAYGYLVLFELLIDLCHK